jgi:hypothetical protein
MADAVAIHITAYDSNGEIVFDGYAKPDMARNTVKLLKEELLTVKQEPVTELPEGVELPA